MVNKSSSEGTPVVGKKEGKPVVAMVPIFNWRTIITAVLGLVVGVVISVGYWVFSPALGSSTTSVPGTAAGGGSTGLFGLLGMEHTGPYESIVRVQVVSPGSDYISLKSLQQTGEYYAAKASSLPFFEYLGEQLAKQTPKLTINTDQLERFIRTEFKWDSVPPVIEMRTISSIEQEASFLAEFVSKVFKDYLVAEENDKRQKEYQYTSVEIENVKGALYKAEQELAAFTPQKTINNPNYIVLNAKIESLQRELGNQVLELNTLIVPDVDTQQEYEKTLQQVRDASAALNTAEQELSALKTQGDNNDISNDAAYIMLNAKIKALDGVLNKLMTGDLQTTGLADMIASGLTTDSAYTNTLEKVNVVSAAISKAKGELAILESNSVQNSTSNLDYQLAQVKVDTLNAELSTLRERLAKLSRQSTGDEYETNAKTSFERTAMALSEAKNELATLERQLGYDRLAMDLDYMAAQKKVDNLNKRMSSLTEKLSSLVGESAAPSETVGYLVAGKPSLPNPLLPERPKASKTIMMGALAGVAIAWILLNFRWIAKGMPSSRKPKPVEDEE